MTAPLPLEEAQARMLDAVTPLARETMPVADADGRWLAGPVFARRTQPWADLSAMDGFATAGTGPWRIIGESAAGHLFEGRLADGEAVRISTGAAVPDGGNAIVLVEVANVTADTLSAAADAPSPRHVRRKGFDFAEGSLQLDGETRLNAARIALALTGGAGEVEVGSLPRVAILDTGDELARGPDDRRPDALPASNGPMVAAMCRHLSSAVERIGPVPDSRDALLRAFERASLADVIVTSGGASVGEHDLVRPVLEAWGAQIDFWKVAIKPGKPLLVGRRGRQWIVGLPGNPASAYVTAFFFVLPLLRRLAGAPLSDAVPGSVPARLAGILCPGGDRREFVRGVLNRGVVRPIDERDSSALQALARANCLIDRPAQAPGAESGALVEVHPLPGA